MPQTCPSCRAKLNVPDTLAGKQIRCPKCKEPFKAVAAESGIQAPRPKPAAVAASKSKSLEPAKKSVARSRDREDDDFDDDRPVRTKKKKRTAAKKPFPWLLVGGIGGGTVAVLAVVAIAIVAFSGGGEKKTKAARPVDEPKPIAAAPLPDALKEPLPATIASDTTQRVKRSTVHLSVKTAAGDTGQGSGFLAFDRGLVVTNAHVLGMLHSNDNPLRIDATINSNQADEIKREAVVLGVDHDEDLALIRLDGDASALPPPLFVDHISPLTELQEVYVFGFPLGTQLGKDITVSKTSISSLRRTKDSLQQIQVNGGMHPGNSGGPVVDARGNVIGVSVSVIRGTLINFAVPAEKVHGLAQGRIVASNFGEPYADGSAVRMPLRLSCLDPLAKIKAMKLEVWTGADGTSRPGGTAQPPAQTGDSKKQAVNLSYSIKEGKGDLIVPRVGLGQALWVQPVLTTSTGKLVWSPAFTIPAATETPLERVSAHLPLKMGDTKERTIDLSSRIGVELRGVKDKVEFGLNAQANILEAIAPQPGNTGNFSVRLDVGHAHGNLDGGRSGKTEALGSQAIALFRGVPYTFLVDPKGKLVEVGHRELSQDYDPTSRGDAVVLAMLLRNAYEAASVSVPEKKLMAMESWYVTVPMLMGHSRLKQSVDVNYKCTYEGIRTTAGRKEGFIRLEGELRPRNIGGDIFKAKVDGYLLLDLQRGYFSKAKIAIREEQDSPDVYAVSTYETTMTRSPGNPNNISPAPAVRLAPAGSPLPGGPLGGGPIAKTPVQPMVPGKVVFAQEGILRADDPIYEGRQAQHVAVGVKLTQGKAYVIDLLHAPNDAYDPFLVVQNPAGQVMAQDDDSGGDLNSRILIDAPTTGEYRLIVTAFSRINQDAPFRVRVVEIEAK